MFSIVLVTSVKFHRVVDIMQRSTGTDLVAGNLIKTKSVFRMKGNEEAGGGNDYKNRVILQTSTPKDCMLISMLVVIE